MINTIYIHINPPGIDLHISRTSKLNELWVNIQHKIHLIGKGPAESYKYKNTLYFFYFTEEMMEKARENSTIYEKRV
jgi:hypothetical protein